MREILIWEIRGNYYRDVKEGRIGMPVLDDELVQEHILRSSAGV